MRIYAEEFPEIKFGYKHDPPEETKVYLIMLLVRFVGLFSSDFYDWFMNRTVTVIGNWVLFPPSHDWKQAFPEYRTFKVLVHELRHLRQRRDNRLWSLRYAIFPLPVLWTERGYKWELEAYGDSMWCDMFFLGFLLVPITTRAKSFTSMDYFWMWGCTTSATRRTQRALQNTLEQIKSGNYIPPSDKFVSPLA